MLRGLLQRREPKVFGIGLIKTGTTSLGAALEALGYDNSHQHRANLLRETQRRNLRAICRHVDCHDSFEDWPWPLLYREIARRYPNSRFILTRRADEECWLQSVKSHAERLGPSLGREMFFGFAMPQGHESAYLEQYRRHLDDVHEYFAAEPDRLLEVCWDDGDGWAELGRFLGHSTPGVPFPRLNTAGHPLAK